MDDVGAHAIRAAATIPAGYTTVTPWIIGPDTRGLIGFLKAAFGAEELGVMASPDGSIGHAEMRIGNAIVMAFDSPKGAEPTPAFIRLYVEDSEAMFRRALDAGAEPVTEPTHLAFGDKVGRVRDPYGNIWWLQQRIEDVGEHEMEERWSNPRWLKAMQYVQESLAEAMRGK